MRQDGYLTLVTAPAQTVITVADVKAHLRIDGNDEDAYLASLIEVAQSGIDGRDGWLGRALVTQTWAFTVPKLSGTEITLPLAPVQQIDSISYTDSLGNVVVIDADEYELVQDSHWPYVCPTGFRWPEQAKNLTVTYTAGFGDPADVPAIIRQYLQLRVGDFYQHRESAVTGTIITNVPAYRDMLENLRVR